MCHVIIGIRTTAPVRNHSMSEQLDQALSRKYDAGFVSNIESETFPPGLDEDVIHRISSMKGEPEWMLEWRLRAYRSWLEMEEPEWAHVHYPKIDF
ncbi:MAG: Fe-S cluster assembly protein SufB, partial [Glaciecola sp.]